MKIERVYQVAIAALVITVLVQNWWILQHRAASPSPVLASATSSARAGADAEGAPVPIAGNGDEVATLDQKAGMSVEVSSVTLSQSGWVAIRDSDGRILGAARFDPGTHENVTIPLLRGTEAGQSYQALLYADNGDRQFDLHADTLITDQDGSVAGSNFTTW